MTDEKPDLVELPLCAGIARFDDKAIQSTKQSSATSKGINVNSIKPLMTCSVAIASISSLMLTGGFFSINGLP
jgi:hypothetical protein